MISQLPYGSLTVTKTESSDILQPFSFIYCCSHIKLALKVSLSSWLQGTVTGYSYGLQVTHYRLQVTGYTLQVDCCVCFVDWYHDGVDDNSAPENSRMTRWVLTRLERYCSMTGNLNGVHGVHSVHVYGRREHVCVFCVFCGTAISCSQIV